MKKFKCPLSRYIAFIMLVLSAISFSFTANFQKEDDKIYWSKDQLLTWDNFKGKPIKSSPHDAFTDSGIDFKYSYSGSDHTLVFDLKSNFIKSKSSVKPDKKKDVLLKHEQGHFDISEIFTRKLHKNIIEEKYKEKTLEKKLQELFNKYLTELGKYQDLYDKETDHSKNEKNQIEWNEKIAKELKELENFTEPHFTMDVK
jgi:hypothetical protein